MSDELIVKVGRLKEMLVQRSINGSPDDRVYMKLRNELVGIPAIRRALPECVRNCSTIREFWNFIKDMFEPGERHKRRAEYLQQAFQPILNALETGEALPDLTVQPSQFTPTVVKPRPDVLMVTVNEHETRAILDAFEAAAGATAVPVPLDGRVYRNLGKLNGTTVFHALSEMGSGSVGAMQQTVDKAIRALDPGAVIAVGVAFGVDEKKQSIGDILLSKQLRLYDLQRMGKQIILRDDKPHATARLIDHFEGFAQAGWTGGATVWSGVLMTGGKLIDDLDYRDQLLSFEIEADGGDMEGAGLYVACHEHKVDWIVVRAICDWADGNKKVNKKQRQKTAAANAAQFLVEAMQYAPLKRQN